MGFYGLLGWFVLIWLNDLFCYYLLLICYVCFTDVGVRIAFLWVVCLLIVLFIVYFCFLICVCVVVAIVWF